MGTNYYKNRNKYTDEELVACYLNNNHSQIKASKKLGVSRETVARAVRRAGIKMDGRKNNGYHEGIRNRGSALKITNNQLVKEYKTLNQTEIAQKYNMHPTSVGKRIKRLGIVKIHETIETRTEHQKCSGYRKRARFYGVEYIPGITLSKIFERDKGICQICGKPADWNDISGGYARSNYPSIDHIIPLSKGGGHTWENVQLAHIGCNSRKCDKIKEAVECHH